MKSSKGEKQFDTFVEKTVSHPEGEGTESGNFGINSYEAEKMLGQSMQNQRKIRLSRTATIVWGVFVILLIIGVASVFIFKVVEQTI